MGKNPTIFNKELTLFLAQKVAEKEEDGFHLREWLMTPLKASASTAEKRYNEAIEKARNVIQRCFDIFKKRWRINLTGYRLQLSAIPTAIVATAVLHNIGIEMNIPYILGDDEEDVKVQELEDDEINDEDEGVDRHYSRQPGKWRQQNIINRFA
uniref:DDE Tnp4 domain-containing protein n=1 Tax=Ditylenchus dipsaci TaxID=166011 RepID=A0A915E585_9BILA